MSWSGLDQRAFPRISARCDIIIHDRIGGLVKTKTQNLGPGGACVLLNRSVEKLSHVHLRLVIGELAQPIECEGRVVWMVKSKAPASGKVMFDIGIEFLDLKALDQERITSFIHGKP